MIAGTVEPLSIAVAAAQQVLSVGWGIRRTLWIRGAGRGPPRNTHCVIGPTTPSTEIRRWDWNARTAVSVFAPKIPSGFSPGLGVRARFSAF
jgi:hypothetical protein